MPQAETRDEPKTIYLKDYAPTPFLVDRIALDIRLDATATRIFARLDVRRRTPGATDPLVLNGVNLTLNQVAIDGTRLTPDQYEVSAKDLTLRTVPDSFVLETDVTINPEANTSLEGLYMSDGLFCTQCEAEGFRKINYNLDRPDSLSVYTVRLTAPKDRFPVLLSNGNPLSATDLEDGLHQAEWHDPHPKPAYLFALVAGDLGFIEDRFTTASGRDVGLRIYCAHGKEGRCTYAMDALKRSMAWDEQRFGLEYDLDVFNIVAVDDFNAGAMENKGLNIFNAALVLASPDTATDRDYERIEGVIAHEYFHNWTGNRITCRDWFQLCLKEGLTVFRDQEFTADMRDATVKRIDDVTMLRAHQFPEDSGGLAHPVRPDHYIKIDNFYTATVYEKGAELVRMLATMLGRETFRAGMELYLRDNDGTAATVEDFVNAFAKASGRDLSEFMRWYAQAGTPRVSAQGRYDGVNQTFTLTLRQTTPPTPNQPDKEPVPIPVTVGLTGESGTALSLHVDGENQPDAPLERVLELTGEERTIVFENVRERPIPSLLRQFSAPVHMESDLSFQDRIVLVSHDADPFTRWETATNLVRAEIAGMAIGQDRSDTMPALIQALGTALQDTALSPAFLARLIAPPPEDDVAQSMTVVDPEAIHNARNRYRTALTREIEPLLRAHMAAYDRSEPFNPGADQAGRRALANTALTLLSSLEKDDIAAHVLALGRSATTMTDRLAALAIIVDMEGPDREAILADFHDTWKHDALVLDKWFSVQARSSRPDTLEQVKRLTGHEGFTLRNPNRVRALIGAFVTGNPLRFHAADGSGYTFFAEQVLQIDRLNPLFAARLFSTVKSWRTLEPGRRAKIQEAFKTVAEARPISDNLFEIVTRMLKG